jgi:hypothetical protein
MAAGCTGSNPFFAQGMVDAGGDRSGDSLIPGTGGRGGAGGGGAGGLAGGGGNGNSTGGTGAGGAGGSLPGFGGAYPSLGGNGGGEGGTGGVAIAGAGGGSAGGAGGGGAGGAGGAAGGAGGRGGAGGAGAGGAAAGGSPGAGGSTPMDGPSPDAPPDDTRPPDTGAVEAPPTSDAVPDIAVVDRGLYGRYYSDLQRTVLFRDKVLDSTITFNWKGGAPIFGMPSDNFSIVWTGYIVPEVSGTYVFKTVSDDGVRLNLGGVDIIDAYHAQSSGENLSAPRTLNAGQRYPIVLEYYEGRYSALLHLYWRRTGDVEVLVPRTVLYPY